MEEKVIVILDLKLKLQCLLTWKTAKTIISFKEINLVRQSVFLSFKETKNQCFFSFTVNKFNKLLVATGYPYDNGRKVEVIDLTNPSKTCVLSADFPYELRSAVGGFTSSGPMICSGYYGYGSSSSSADCYSLRSNGQFVKINELTMDTKRDEASSIVTEDGKLMISGGYSGDYLADTEIVNVPESKTEDGFELPNGMYHQCSVLINTRWGAPSRKAVS